MTFIDRTVVLRDDAIIDCLIRWVQLTTWHQLSTTDKPWTAPVYVLGHSWPTFSLTLPVQSALFTLLWAEFLYFAQCPKHQGGVNSFRVTLHRIFVNPSRALSQKCQCVLNQLIDWLITTDVGAEIILLVSQNTMACDVGPASRQNANELAHRKYINSRLHY